MLVKVDGNEAKVLGVDIQNDIAVLQIDKQNDRSMTPLKKCTSMPKIGDPVIAIGNPFGFEKTVTSGIISGIHRSLDSVDKFPLIDLIQTDASINPGNSGGPLLDGSNGCVLGVNTAIVSSSGASSGLGFSIPIDTVELIANDIISGKEETDVSIGVSVLPDTYAHGLGVKGVVIADVMPESIASKIGLEGTRRDQYGRPYIGDIIVGINDEKIEKRSDLYRILRELKKDDVIELVVLRSIGIVRFTIQL
jgi:S1-C subfamily serine protease